MTSAGGSLEQAFANAKDQYCGMGGRRRRCSVAAVDDRDLTALLAGGRRRWLRELGPGAGRRPGGHRPLSGQGTHGRRAAVRSGQGAVALARLASLEPPRQLRRDRRPQGRARSTRARTLSGLDRLGQIQANRHGLQPDVFRSPPGGRRLHPGPSRSGRPPVLDRSWHRLPAHRRGDRQGARTRPA